MDRRPAQRPSSPPGRAPGGERETLSRDADPVSFAVEVASGPPALISVTGEFDIAGAPAFEAALRHIDFHGLQGAVLDLSELDFIDATGLRAVLGLHRKCVEFSVALVIVPGPRRVQRVFALTSTDVLLPFRRGTA